MSELVVCKNCDHSFSGKYCNNCGEKIYTEKDRSVRHILSEGFHFVTHLDGTLFTTLKAIFTTPGKLSLDYCNGLRKKYFKPISFFLLLVILYLLFPLFDGLNTKAYYHVRHPLYGSYALRKSLEVLQAKHLTDTQFGEAFGHASEKISKFLLFIIIPVMACFSWTLSFKKRKYYYDNFIFSIEASSFLILWGFLVFPLVLLVLHKVFPVLTNLSDAQMIITSLGIFTVYILIAAKRFFQFSWWYCALYSLLYTFTMAIFIQFIYKFILFFITIQFV